MSESHAVETARERAKHLLALARAGDVTVIRELRQHLPRLARADDEEFAATVKLADVQHAVAVSRGMKSWAELRKFLESANPLQVQAERFLLAIREEKTARASELLASHPAIAQYSIHAAAAACDDVAVERFLATDPSLAVAGAPPNNASPVMYACGSSLQVGNDELKQRAARCLQLLLDAGGDANAFILFDGGDGEASISALYFACIYDNAQTVALLLKHGANPNDGESVYHSAELDHRGCLQALMEYGAELSAPHALWGNTPLYFLSNYKPHNPRCESSERGMAWLLEHGADPNVPSLTGEKWKDSPTRAEMPLHRVASHGKGVDIVRTLLLHGAQVDAQRGDGKTAYALAIRTGNVAVAEFLVNAGADKSRLAPIDDLIGACLAADETRARAIIAQHPDAMKHPTIEDQRAINLAVEEEREASVKLMAALGWDLTTEGEWGGTPLHWAAWNARPQMVRLLIDLGAPVNKRDSTYGSSPIAWTAHGSTQNGGASRSFQGDEQAAKDAFAQIANMLLDAGATREASYNKWNEAPESMASREVLRVLKDRGFAL